MLLVEVQRPRPGYTIATPATACRPPSLIGVEGAALAGPETARGHDSVATLRLPARFPPPRHLLVLPTSFGGENERGENAYRVTRVRVVFARRLIASRAG
jgi:hypothetical protein